MSGWPRVGFVISLYNQVTYLDEAVDSVLSQSRRPHEVVVVDDGSIDGGYLKAKSYERFGVKVLRTSRVGVSKALNAALSEISTDYVCMQAADDVSEPDRMEWQVEVAESLDVSAVFGLPVVIDERSRIIPESYASEFFARSHFVDPLRRLFETGNWICASSALLRRRTVLKAGSFHNGLVQLQDFYLWAQMASMSNFAFLDDPVVRYRRPSMGGNLSSGKNNSRMRSEMSFVYRNFFRRASLERMVEAFPSLIDDFPQSLKRTTCRLLLGHPDLIVKQVGFDLLLELIESDAVDPADVGFSLNFDEFGLDIDRRVERDQILSSMRRRLPWQT